MTYNMNQLNIKNKSKTNEKKSNNTHKHIQK